MPPNGQRLFVQQRGRWLVINQETTVFDPLRPVEFFVVEKEAISKPAHCIHNLPADYHGAAVGKICGARPVVEVIVGLVQTDGRCRAGIHVHGVLACILNNSGRVEEPDFWAHDADLVIGCERTQ